MSIVLLLDLGLGQESGTPDGLSTVTASVKFNKTKMGLFSMRRHLSKSEL